MTQETSLVVPCGKKVERLLGKRIRVDYLGNQGYGEVIQVEGFTSDTEEGHWATIKMENELECNIS